MLRVKTLALDQQPLYKGQSTNIVKFKTNSYSFVIVLCRNHVHLITYLNSVTFSTGTACVAVLHTAKLGNRLHSVFDDDSSSTDW